MKTGARSGSANPTAPPAMPPNTASKVVWVNTKIGRKELCFVAMALGIVGSSLSILHRIEPTYQHSRNVVMEDVSTHILVHIQNQQDFL
jgi:hypothetical protein